MNYFVYVYSDEQGIPFYVGKGTKTRHLYRRNHLVTPPAKENIQVFACSTEQEAFEMEMFFEIWMVGIFEEFSSKFGCFFRKSDFQL